jgi:poly(A) polymerase
LVAGDPAGGARAETGLGVALEAAAAWRERRFPLAGADVLALGYPSGPDVGSLLRAVEEWWIDEDFAPDREACLARLRALADSISPVPPKAPGT